MSVPAPSQTHVVGSVPTRVDLIAYRGDTFKQTFSFSDAGGPLDLGGTAMAAFVQSPLGDLTQLEVAVVDAGTIEVSFPDGGLDADVYKFDVQADQAGVISTWIRGHLRVLWDVTP